MGDSMSMSYEQGRMFTLLTIEGWKEKPSEKAGHICMFKGEHRAHINTWGEAKYSRVRVQVEEGGRLVGKD